MQMRIMRPTRWAGRTRPDPCPITNDSPRAIADQGTADLTSPDGGGRIAILKWIEAAKRAIDSAETMAEPGGLPADVAVSIFNPSRRPSEQEIMEAFSGEVASDLYTLKLLRVGLTEAAQRYAEIEGLGRSKGSKRGARASRGQPE